MKYIISLILLFNILLFSCAVSFNENKKEVENKDLSPPENINILPHTKNSAIISWQENSNANSYSIYTSMSEVGTYKLLQTVNDNTHIIPNLFIDTKYYFKVSTSINNIGESDLSHPISIVIVDILPPEGLSASMISSTSISISWSSVTNATGYKIYRALSSSGSYSLIGNTTETSFLDKNLETGTTYFYKISGIKNEGEGPSSNVVSAFTPVSIPVNINGVVESMDSIKLTWSSVHGATEYVIYRSLYQEDQYKILTTITGLSFTDTGLSQQTDYYYKISAKNTNGEGELSDFIKLSIAPPEPPVNITFSVLSSSSIRLDWENAIGATGYRVYRLSGSEYSPIANVSTNTFTNTGLNKNVNYIYKISSINAAGEGIFSEQIITTIKNPDRPSNFRAEPYTDTSIKLSWDIVEGATFYEILYVYVNMTIATVTTNSYIVTGLRAGEYRSYEYVIRAVNAIGSSSYTSSRNSYVKPVLLIENEYYTSTHSGIQWLSIPADGQTYIVSMIKNNVIGNPTVSCYWDSTSNMNANSNIIFNSKPLHLEPQILPPISGGFFNIHTGGNFSIIYSRE